jgi:translation initiation factor IF-1
MRFATTAFVPNAPRWPRVEPDRIVHESDCFRRILDRKLYRSAENIPGRVRRHRIRLLQFDKETIWIANHDLAKLAARISGRI